MLGWFSIMVNSVKFFHDYIKILKKWRKNLWDASNKNMIVMYLPLMEGICEIKKQLLPNKNAVPHDIYLQFENEFSMTMYLLYKCILRIINRQYPLNQEQEEALKSIQNKLSGILSEINISSIQSSLDNEYLVTLKDSLGLNNEIIQAAMKKGIAINNVLNEEPKNNNLKI